LQKINLLDPAGVGRIHLIGVGGISMSGLAEILASKGYEITGSDMRASNITEKLEKLGVRFWLGHRAENVEGADLVVYTAAVKDDNPELMAARQMGIPSIDRATLLGELMKGYPLSIAVSGTHGKTTTTSMISMIMLEANLDPTIHIGGELEAIGGTTRIGGNRYFIAEACEYTGSFLKLHPYLAIILNIEFDHADYFQNINHVSETFLKFAGLVPENGYLIACADDPRAMGILDCVRCKKVTFGLNPESIYSAIDISYDNMGCATFTLMYRNEAAAVIKLSVPGIHNVTNSLAAIAATSTLGCKPEVIKNALKKFTGTHRRFELMGVSKNITVIDDYAHHPSEVAATLKAAKNCTKANIWCVFQPHTYTRTKYLMDEFAVAFGDADTVILADIYAAREKDNGEVNSGMLAERINQSGSKAIYMKSFDDIVEYLDRHARSGDLIITMGAGDIYKVGEKFLEVRKNLAIS
jgi:UDP-N-acetylmuramate--alanine ligase